MRISGKHLSLFSWICILYGIVQVTISLLAAAVLIAIPDALVKAVSEASYGPLEISLTLASWLLLVASGYLLATGGKGRIRTAGAISLVFFALRLVAVIPAETNLQASTLQGVAVMLFMETVTHALILANGILVRGLSIPKPPASAGRKAKVRREFREFVTANLKVLVIIKIVALLLALAGEVTVEGAKAFYIGFYLFFLLLYLIAYSAVSSRTKSGLLFVLGLVIADVALTVFAILFADFGIAGLTVDIILLILIHYQLRILNREPVGMTKRKYIEIIAIVVISLLFANTLQAAITPRSGPIFPYGPDICLPPYTAVVYECCLPSKDVKGMCSHEFKEYEKKINQSVQRGNITSGERLVHGEPYYSFNAPAGYYYLEDAVKGGAVKDYVFFAPNKTNFTIIDGWAREFFSLTDSDVSDYLDLLVEGSTHDPWRNHTTQSNL
ncbi:MAG: hypothetical protein HY518_03365, partial [Candidatus Aenigmarchaeota archaeon]|nr:hypothetical protein [Candidatus Aenigmarchaeota archaeon]